jgi:uncharacterized membrane protein YfcA
MMNMIPSLAVIAVGVISGFLNACASGANTQSLLLLLTLGVDPLTANATNHLGGLTGLATASYRYIKNGIAKPQRSLYLAIPVIIGASGGSYYAASMLKGEQITGLAEIAVMIAIASLLISPDKWKQEGEVNPKSKISQSYRLIAALLGVGIWDGMVGAEAGMLILVILVWLGSYSLKQAVATKTILLSTAGVISTGIYASRGQVDLHIAYPLIAGNIAGAWIGSKVTVGRESEKIIYFLLLITMTGQSLLLFIRWVQH